MRFLNVRLHPKKNSIFISAIFASSFAISADHSHLCQLSLINLQLISANTGLVLRSNLLESVIGKQDMIYALMVIAYPASTREANKPESILARQKLEQRFRSALFHIQSKSAKLKFPGFENEFYSIADFFAALKDAIRKNKNYGLDVFNNQRASWVPLFGLIDETTTNQNWTMEDTLQFYNNYETSLLLETYAKLYGFTEVELFGDHNPSNPQQRKNNFSYRDLLWEQLATNK